MSSKSSTKNKDFLKIQEAELAVCDVPAWLYHSDHGAKIFNTPEEYNEAIEAGWVGSPTKPNLTEVEDTVKEMVKF